MVKRILLLLSAASWADARECVESARRAAARPDGLSIGVSLTQAPDEASLREMCDVPGLQYLTPACDPWQDFDALWRGETHVLAGHAAMRFARGWDRGLMASLRQCHLQGAKQAVLTGYLPRQVDPVDAVYPVALRRFDRRGRILYQRGTPLRYARSPQRSAFLHPDFCFAPSLFFRAVQDTSEPLFLAAYRQKWALYTLARPLIRMAWDDPLPPCAVPCEDDTGMLFRFEQRFDVRFAARQASNMARCGIFNRELSFATRVPLSVRVQEALRNLDNRASTLRPLCVTAWLMIPGMPLDEQRMTCFRRLHRMRHLPLVAYADSDCIQRVRISDPHALEYKSRYGLNVPVEAMRQNRINYVRLCKPFLMAQSREKFLNHSHYIWLDWDYLRYPAYERAALDWETVCCDRIVLAMVDGEPDTSMIVVPQDMMDALCREVAVWCQTEWKLRGALPEEKALWLNLMTNHPDWFVIHQFPGRRELLAITMLTRGEELHTRA